MVQQLEAYRDRYVDLYELAPVGYVTLDEEGYVQEINVAGSQLLGTDRDALIGFPFENHVQSQDRERFRHHLHRCCVEKLVMSFEVGVVAKNGESITVQLRGVPLESLKGGDTFCKIAITDITERKEAEESLQESEERFRTVADYTYDWEYWRGLDGRFRYVSPSCQRITGYSPEEFMADPALLERIVHPDDRKQLKRHFRSESPHPGPHNAEYRIISRTGEERWIEHICQPVYGVDQHWLGQRASNRDITDRKNAELDLKKRIEAMEKSLAERAG
jgi:PAS domain S-box-containing protein